jgi:hypothetical protein
LLICRALGRRTTLRLNDRQKNFIAAALGSTTTRARSAY